MIVVRGALKSVERGGVFLVKLANGVHASKRHDGEFLRERAGLAAHPLLEIPHEMALIDPVLRRFERRHAFRQVDRRRHGADAAQLLRRRRSEIAGELQREVAAKRVAGDRDRSEAIYLDELAHHEMRIMRETRMVQAVGERFGAATIALIQAHRIEARGERLIGEAAHVMRGARALQAVQQQDGGMLPGPALPVALREHAGAGRHIEIARLRRRQCGEVARFSPRVQRHPMASTPSGKRGVFAHSFLSAYTRKRVLR